MSKQTHKSVVNPQEIHQGKGINCPMCHKTYELIESGKATTIIGYKCGATKW